jgi:hypothetical protein
LPKVAIEVAIEFSGDKTNGAAPRWNLAGILLYMKNAFG